MLFSDDLEGFQPCLIMLLAAVIVLVALFFEHKGQALKDLQESMSETERSEDLGAQKRKLRAEKTRGKDRAHSARKETLYPFKDLQALTVDDSDSNEELSPSDGEVLEEQAARHKNDHIRPTGRKVKVKFKIDGPYSPSLPPAPSPYATGKCSTSFCSPEVRHAMRQMFPVIETDDGGRGHRAVEHKQVKELAESVRAYGVNANFTVSQVERLASIAMTPTDWQYVAKACLLTMGQYLEWKALWHGACQAQARSNATAGGEAARWTFEMLTGQGEHAADQTGFPLAVFSQISTAALRAWKALTNKGEISGNLTKIVQGPNEPFSDFVARLLEAAGKIFGDQEQAFSKSIQHLVTLSTKVF